MKGSLPGASQAKNPANAGGWNPIPGQKIPGGGHGNPLGHFAMGEPHEQRSSGYSP